MSMGRAKKFNLSEINTNEKNPFPFKDGGLEDLAAKIKRDTKFLELRPIVYDAKTKMILGGNKRYEALIYLGYKEVPKEWVKAADDLTEEEKKRFIFADNFNAGEFNIDFVSEEEAKEWSIEFQEDEEDIDFENIKSNEAREEKDNSKTVVCYNCGVNVKL